MNSELFHYIFLLSRNPYIANTALFFSYLLPFAVVIILIIWSVSFSFQKVHNLFLFCLSGLGAVAVSHLLKLVFSIDRPFIKWSDITPLVHSAGFSFPSDHAAVMAGLAGAGFFIDHKLGILLIIFAVLVGISRIVLGVHYPLDILAGWLVGFVVGSIVMNFNKA